MTQNRSMERSHITMPDVASLVRRVERVDLASTVCEFDRFIRASSQVPRSIVLETAFEYRRLLILTGLGINGAPLAGSLLSAFVQIATTAPPDHNSHLPEAYVEVFGHPTPYPWTTPVSAFRGRA